MGTQITADEPSETVFHWAYMQTLTKQFGLVLKKWFRQISGKLRGEKYMYKGYSYFK